MARGELLFAKYELQGALTAQEKKAKEAVDSMNGDTLLTSSTADVCIELEGQFIVNVPALKHLSTEVEQREASVDVSHHMDRVIFDRSQPFYLTGTEITFFVPFEGDAVLFFCQPNNFTLNPPRAEVRNDELVFVYTRLDHDAEAVKRDLAADLASIEKYLEWQRNQVKQYNDTLRPKLHQWIDARRDKLLKDKGMVAALGFPMRRRADAPQTYIAPTVQRKPPVYTAAEAVKPFEPEPTLDMGEYEHILSAISNMVHVM